MDTLHLPVAIRWHKLQSCCVDAVALSCGEWLWGNTSLFFTCQWPTKNILFFVALFRYVKIYQNVLWHAFTCSRLISKQNPCKCLATIRPLEVESLFSEPSSQNLLSVSITCHEMNAIPWNPWLVTKNIQKHTKTSWIIFMKSPFYISIRFPHPSCGLRSIIKDVTQVGHRSTVQDLDNPEPGERNRIWWMCWICWSMNIHIHHLQYIYIYNYIHEMVNILHRSYMYCSNVSIFHPFSHPWTI